MNKTCLWSDASGRCDFDAAENSDYCLMHHYLKFPELKEYTEITARCEITFKLHGHIFDDLRGQKILVSFLSKAVLLNSLKFVSPMKHTNFL